MNMESLIEAFICHLHVRPNGKSSASAAAADGYTGRRHFLDDPKILPCCRQTACNKCVIKYAQNHPGPSSSTNLAVGGTTRKAASTNSYDTESLVFYCPFCSNKFKFNVNTNTNQCDLESNESVSKEYDRNIIEINHYLVKKLENSMKNIEDRLVSKETSLKKRKEYIRNEIRSQVEAIKSHLDNIEQEMLDTLDDSCKNIESSLRKFEQTYRPELEDKKAIIENLKSNAFSYAYGLPVEANGGGEKNDKKNKLSLTQQQMSVEKCIQSLNDLNHLNHTISEIIGELRFEPSIELPRKSVIGNLTKIKEVNLVEMFKTIKLESQINKIPSIKGSGQLMPISPRYLCIADPYNLFFTDSQTKQVIQLKLDTGDFVRSTNLSSLIKNPDGICVNTRTGHIYVSDHELKIIFKIDPQLKLVKKFATKELKWPRGMFYDSTEAYRGQNGSTSTTDDINHNCLYVCDYSNQRIAIFNSNDQLRDCLTIPINSNEPIRPGIGNGKDRSVNDDAFKKYDKQNLIEEECKFCPLNVLVTRNQILCTDDWTGGNCIRIFDKKTHMLLKNVGHLNVWDPLSLITDDWGNLFTIGRLYYETGATHLFCFNKDGDLLYKVNLNINSELITDMALDTYSDKTNYKLICAGEKRLYIFEFLHAS